MKTIAKNGEQNGPTLMAKCQHREQNNCTLAAEMTIHYIKHFSNAIA